MNKSGDLGSFSGQLTSIPKKTTDQFRNEPIKTIETVEAQFGTKPPPPNSAKPQDKKGADTSEVAGSKDIDRTKATSDIIKKIYEESEPKVKAPPDKTIEAAIGKNPKGTPEEIQKKLAADKQFKQHLHKTTYFDPTFNPQKKAQEERPAERIAGEEEQKEKKKMEELRVEEKKKEELSPAIKQGTIERHPGISG